MYYPEGRTYLKTKWRQLWGPWTLAKIVKVCFNLAFKCVEGVFRHVFIMLIPIISKKKIYHPKLNTLVRTLKKQSRAVFLSGLVQYTLRHIFGRKKRKAFSSSILGSRALSLLPNSFPDTELLSSILVSSSETSHSCVTELWWWIPQGSGPGPLRKKHRRSFCLSYRDILWHSCRLYYRKNLNRNTTNSCKTQILISLIILIYFDF